MSRRPDWLVQKLLYGLLIIPVLGVGLWVMEGNPFPSVAEIIFLGVWVGVMLIVIRAFRVWPFDD